MSSKIALPKPHSLRAKWAPLYFFPVAGSSDRLTIAVIVIDRDGKGIVLQAPGLSRLNCLFLEQGSTYVSVARLAIESVQKKLEENPSALLEAVMD